MSLISRTLIASADDIVASAIAPVLDYNLSKSTLAGAALVGPALTATWTHNEIDRSATRMMRDSSGVWKWAQHNLLKDTFAYDTNWTAASITLTDQGDGSALCESTTANNTAIKQATFGTGRFPKGQWLGVQFKAKQGADPSPYIHLQVLDTGAATTRRTRTWWDLSDGTFANSATDNMSFLVTPTNASGPDNDGFYTFRAISKADVDHTGSTELRIFPTTVSNGVTTAVDNSFLIKECYCFLYPMITDEWLRSDAGEESYTVRVGDGDDNGNDIGARIEPEKTNNALHCRDWSDAAYTATNVTATKDATGIDGISSAASTLEATAALGTIFQTITLGSAERTSSVYVKYVAGSSGTIEFTDDGGVSYTDITALINAISYTRITITTTQANPSIGFRITTDEDKIEVDFLQCEEGSTTTSPIVTGPVARVRQPDLLTLTDVGDINASLGTWVVSASTDTTLDTGVDRVLFQLDDGGATDRQRLFWDSGNAELRWDSVDSGAGAAGLQQLPATPATDGTSFSVGIRYANDDVRAAQDGAYAAADTLVLFPLTDAPTTLRIGKGDAAGSEWVGHISRLSYAPRAYADATLRTVTGG